MANENRTRLGVALTTVHQNRRKETKENTEMKNYVKEHAIFLTAVQQNPHFPGWLKDIEEEQPTIPAYDPKGDNDQNAWAYYTGMAEGYKLLASKLGVKL